MFTQKLLSLLVFLMLSGCSCLNVYQDQPVKIRSDVSGVANVNSWLGGGCGAVDLNAAANIVKNSFAIWINYETSGPIVGQVATLAVNGKIVDEIKYNTDQGFKTTGKKELVSYLVIGENTVTFQSIIGSSVDKKVVQRAARKGTIDGFQALQHNCYQTESAYEKIFETYQVIYKPL